MADFLLELFSEEIPARMQADAAAHLQNAMLKALESAGLTGSNAQNFVTPRRLAVSIQNLPAVQADVTVEKKGPKVSAPQAAIDGFLKSSGLTLDRLEKRMVGKDETYFAVSEQKGQPTAAILKTIVEKILAEFPWPKSMRWGSGNVSWVRPLHAILCLFDGKIVPVEFAGITAGNVTYGHRFLAPQAITITAIDEYATALKAAHVLADASERRAEMLRQAEALAAKGGLTLKRDDGLMGEVTGLIEWPTVLMGTIDDAYMDLPPEVLISEMRAHQKYVALLDKNGVFSNQFLIVSNMVTQDGGKAIVAGNERVLRARLSDGRFFFDQDRKKPLSAWAEGLKGVTFHAKIGTMAEKVARIETLARTIAEKTGADTRLVQRAASLCKADLTTGMVGEFPDLQGVMGRYYALAQGENAEVADAIRDHYLPLGPDSVIPTQPVSICVALADKFDTLISMFAANEKPTGSKDPFALRRSALGIIRIILENNLRLPLKAFLNEELVAFFGDRLAVQLKDKGIRHDIIKAVMANGDDDLVRVVMRAEALQNFLKSDDGANLLTAYKRATNIVEIAEKKYGKTYSPLVQWNTLIEEEEVYLLKVIHDVNAKYKDIFEQEKFIEVMGLIATLRNPVDAFFEKIMVNTDNVPLRDTRLSLLSYIRLALNNIANFALLEE